MIHLKRNHKFFLFLIVCLFSFRQSDQNTGKKIFEARYHDFFTFKKFHQPSEFDCEKEIVNDVANKILESKCKKAIFYVCTAFPSGKKKGKEFTDLYVKNFENCFLSKDTLKNINLTFKSMGIEQPFYIPKDTTIENISLKKDDLLTLECFNSIRKSSKKAADYLLNFMTRVEIFAE